MLFYCHNISLTCPRIKTSVEVLFLRVFEYLKRKSARIVLGVDGKNESTASQELYVKQPDTLEKRYSALNKGHTDTSHPLRPTYVPAGIKQLLKDLGYGNDPKGEFRDAIKIFKSGVVREYDDTYLDKITEHFLQGHGLIHWSRVNPMLQYPRDSQR